MTWYELRALSIRPVGGGVRSIMSGVVKFLECPGNYQYLFSPIMLQIKKIKIGIFGTKVGGMSQQRIGFLPVHL